MSFSPDALRVILALFYFEAWPTKRIARLLKLDIREINNFLEVIREFHSHPPAKSSLSQPMRRGLQDDFF